jgi:hypothetical protein
MAGAVRYATPDGRAGDGPSARDAHGDTAALVEAVRTGKARLGTKVQPAARSGRVEGFRAIDGHA